MGGAGDRQQLGRALDDAQRERAPAGIRRRPSLKRRRPAGSARLAVAGPPPRRRLTISVDDAADDRGDDDVVEELEVVAPLFPVVADRSADQRRSRAPRGCEPSAVSR